MVGSLGRLLREFSDSRRCGRASAALHRVPSSIVDKSLTRLPKTLGGVVPSGESCLCSRGPEGVGVTHLSGLFFSSQRRDAEQRRARESGLCPQGWAQLQCAAGGTEDKTWDSGCCCVSSVVRRPPHVAGKKKQNERPSFSVVLLFGRWILWDGHGRAANWLVPGPPARHLRSVFEKDYYRELVDAGGCGCGWAWPPGRDCVGGPIHAAPLACANPLYS